MLPGHGRLSTSRTVSHKQSSGKIRVSIAAKLFGERALKNTYIPWYLVPGTRLLCVFCISRCHLFLRPATRTGTFSALDWDRLPSKVALSLCAKLILRCVPGIAVVRMPGTLHCISCSITMATFFFMKTRKTICKFREKNPR